MLIGQDPTIQDDPHKVETVLRLDHPTNPLARSILESVFGGLFYIPTVYATNFVKCSLEKVPSKTADAEEYLRPFFDYCKTALRAEIRQFAPDIVITFGQPAFRLFRINLMDSHLLSTIPVQTRTAFTGEPFKASTTDASFDFVPCVHWWTAMRYKHAYGESMTVLRDYLARRIHEPSR